MTIRDITHFCAVIAFVFSLSGCNSDLKRAREYASKKQYDLASETYELILKQEPKNKEALRESADLYCTNKFPNNFKCFSKAQILYKTEPKDTSIQEWYKNGLFGNAFDTYIANQLKSARDKLNEYAKLAPTDARAFFLLANIQARLNATPPDVDPLKEAIELYRKAIKHSSPTFQVALDNKVKDAFLHYEAYISIGNIYEVFLIQDKDKFDKTQEGKKEKNKEKFQANEEYFNGLLKAYQSAAELGKLTKDPFKKCQPFLKTGTSYANFKEDFESALSWAKKAEAQCPDVSDVVANLQAIYARLVDETKKAGKRKRKQVKIYEKAYEKYSQKLRELIAKQKNQ